MYPNLEPNHIVKNIIVYEEDKKTFEKYHKKYTEEDYKICIQVVNTRKDLLEKVS